MPPMLGPDVPSAHPRGPVNPRGRRTIPFKGVSAKSRTSSLEEGTVPGRSPARSTSSVSIAFDDSDVDVARVKGLRHANVKLEARRYKSVPFAEQLLQIVHSLRIPLWSAKDITPQSIQIQKVSGSLTNAVFFVSCPSVTLTPVLLLRIYGPSSGSLISRPRELHTLYVLSSQYHIGPQVYGTFENGRVEEYFHSTTLTAADLRDPKISSWIGARMAELHQVDIGAIEGDTEWIGAKRNVKSWLSAAREVLELPSVPESVRRELDLDVFEAEWTSYMHWVEEQESKLGACKRVFAHNDAQYGNLLRLTDPKGSTAEHRQIIVVDFEYASPNPAAFDIANHFHEWTANYHGPNPHILDPNLYPTLEQRQNFYRAYIVHSVPSTASDATPAPLLEGSLEQQISKLDGQVRMWSPASHAMWAIWGIVQAREALEGMDGEVEFDYIGYAKCRMEGFRRELRALFF